MGKKPVVAKAGAKAADSSEPLKHLIILVHGAGRYGKYEDETYKPDTGGWFDKAREALIETHDVAQSALESQAAFGDNFHIEPVIFDGVFETFRQHWVEQADAWKALVPEAKAKGFDDTSIGRVQTFLRSGGKDTFFWNNALDVLLYSFPTVKRHVRDMVMAQIGALLTGLEDKYNGWSVVAHSLGTAVFNDSYIAWLASQTKPPRGPTLVCTLSNLQQLLTNHDPDPYNPPIMKPGIHAPSPQAYIEGRHKLDFIAWLDPYNPPWRKGAGYSKIDDLSTLYLDGAVADWSDDLFETLATPHGITHYLRQPKLAGRLWSTLLERDLDEADIVTAIEQRYSDETAEAKIATALKAKVDKVLKAYVDSDVVGPELLEALKLFFGGKN